MTAREMQYLFGVQINQFDQPLELTSDDIEYWLNKAQLELVKNKFQGVTRSREGFEQSQSIIDDLKTLVVKSVTIPAKYGGDASSAIDSYFIDYAEFPEDQLYLISHRSQIRYKLPEITWSIIDGKRVTEEGTVSVVANRYAQLDDIFKMLHDPFNTTRIKSPLIDIGDNEINVYTDKTFIVENVIINYIKVPKRISITNNEGSELPEQLHEEIIQRAVDSFLDNTRNLKERLQRETPTIGNQPIEQYNE